VPLLFSHDGEILPVPFQTGQPLGLFPDIVIDQQTITFPPQGQLVFYTDGVTDATNEDGNLFEIERLIQTARMNIELPAQTVCDRIWKTVEQHQGDSPQSDDATLVVVSSTTAT
jgi:phosphoserine phosphatase RsbU/P